MHGFYFIQDLAVILVVAGLVGWACQRVGLSVIVGFLVAGMVVGPHTPPFSMVTDGGRIETLSQVGLVFLMFAIGLGLSLRKLRRLGFGLLLATGAGALVMYYLSRLMGAALGWGTTEGLFLAGMLMVSSSAIIGKILHETGANHERAGQLAMGVSVLEDIVAVVMLTVLTSLVQLGGAEAAQGAEGVGATLLHLGAFVVLAGVGGLLLVPWLLKQMSISADEELQTLGLAALLFGLAVVAQRAGYSLALGAFLLGTIVAETPHRHQVERTFAGMRDVFSAVFFVSIGMQIDPRELVANAGLIFGVTSFVLVARPLAVATGLVLIGTPPKDALRTGLTGTPIGEFSFIIAQLGVGAALVPAKFYPLAVGVSLLTTLAAPVLTRRSEWIAGRWIAQQPKWVGAWQRFYQNWLERLKREQKRSPLWQLSRKRFVQIGVEMLAVSGLLLFSGQLFAVVQSWLGTDWAFANGPEIIFWTLLSLILLAPVVAIWRNCSALALLYAQVSTRGHPQAARLAPLIETGLKVLAGAGLFFWLVAILPAEGTARWLLLASALVAIAALVLLRQKLIYWHSQLEVELHSVIETGESRMTATTAPWLQPHGDWQLQMIDCTLPDLADCQGPSIAELELRSRSGCSVVGTERQGFMTPLPAPTAVLYPRDKVLLLGTPEQVRAGRVILGAVSGAPVAESLFEEVRMEALAVPNDSRAAGRTLGELSPSQKHKVQIAGLHRGGLRVLNPGADERVRGGDELLTLGALDHLRDFKDWLQEPAD
ncbi:MAG: cation:proton antiporter [Undibacterium sp.]|nr:cation:proton antiporter [Opitutaceae bacterium]